MKNQAKIYSDKLNENLIMRNDTKVFLNYLAMQYIYNNKLYNLIEDYKIYPYKLDIEPCTRCFLNCRYCQVPYWDRNKLEDLSFEKFKKIVDGLPYLLELKIQGQGEPLLNQELFQMINYATQKGIITRFNTNGMLLNDKIIHKIMETGVFEIRLSLDGATRDTNEKMRPGLDFDKVINNVKMLIEARGKNDLPLINIWTLMTNLNVNEMKQLIQLCSELKVDGLMIQTKLSTRNDKNIEGKVEKDTVDIYNLKKEDYVNELYQEAKKNDLYLEVHTNKWMSEECHCWWLWNSVYISSDGYVVPCSIINNPKQINFGNIFEKNFENIWFGEQYGLFRENTLKMNINFLCKWCYKRCS